MNSSLFIIFLILANGNVWIFQFSIAYVIQEMKKQWGQSGNEKGPINFCFFEAEFQGYHGM